MFFGSAKSLFYRQWKGRLQWQFTPMFCCRYFCLFCLAVCLLGLVTPQKWSVSGRRCINVKSPERTFASGAGNVYSALQAVTQYASTSVPHWT